MISWVRRDRRSRDGNGGRQILGGVQYGTILGNRRLGIFRCRFGRRPGGRVVDPEMGSHPTAVATKDPLCEISTGILSEGQGNHRLSGRVVPVAPVSMIGQLANYPTSTVVTEGFLNCAEIVC